MAQQGETLSTQTIEKMKQSKIKRMQSKYKWELITPYLDKNLDIGSRNRSKTFISFRKFKELVGDGNSIKEISKTTSKHLVQFYSNFAQGKITILEEDFKREYDNGLSLDDISKKYKIARDDLTYLRQLYGQKNKGAKYIHRKKTEVPLTQRQKEILYGSMMGDGYRMSSSSAAFKHCETQKDYLLWKYKEFKSIASKNSLKKVEKIDKRSETTISTWKFYTHANSDVEKCISLFYTQDDKQITEEILNCLSPLSIAVWLMDDGQTDWSYRNKVRYNHNNLPIFKFCTDSYSKESCENIKKWFKERYDISVELKERVLSNRIGYRIKVSIVSVNKFIQLVEPYILPMFNYKINYNEYVKERKDKEIRVVGHNVLECPLGADFSVLSIKEQDEKINDIVYFYQSRGVNFLIERQNKWESHMNSVFDINPNNLINDDHISFSNLGNKFLMSHFSNFWEAKAKGGQSPKEVFDNKEYLSDIIRKIIVQGYFPSKEKILKALQRYRGNKQVSGFMPCVAKSIYHKYCEEDSRVFDFCAGYGGRLFGAMACDKVKSYTCSEVNFETYSNLHDLYRTLRLHREVEKEVSIFNQDSILAMKQFADKSFDFCFTSPPYFNAEIYSDDSSQSCNRYKSYSGWFEGFLIKAVQEAMRISEKVGINIANVGGYMIADDLERYLKSENITYKVDKIRMPQYGGDYRYEPIFVI
jgi:hypothetical protein